MKGTFMDFIMYFFILIVVLAALRNPSGFAKDVVATGSTAQNFGVGMVGVVPVST